MDILFINKIPNYYFDENVDIYHYYYYNTIPTSLLYSTPQNKMISKLYEVIKNIIKNMKSDENYTYQKLGPDLWNYCFTYHKDLSDNIISLNKYDAFAYDCNNILDFFNYNKEILYNNTFCIHWYNGNPEVKKIINNFDEKLINPENSVFERVIYNIIN